jgi:hypothetical protein
MTEGYSKVTISSEGPICQTKKHCPPHPQPPCPPHCSNQEFTLSEGVNVHVEPGKEVDHDFVLNHNPFKDCGTISGTVKDRHGRCLENALVKVFDQHHHPVAHVFTNKEGQFLICIKAGHYIIKAVR